MTDESKQEAVVLVHTERTFITASMAARFLKMNIENNRPVSENRVSQYARDMRTGHWKENGDTIKFAATGELIDGQHRLKASLECGVGFWALVAYGVKKDAFITIDRNQVRSTGQQLRLTRGISDYNNVAGTLTWLWRFREGIMLITGAPTSIEAEELLQHHPKLLNSVAVVRRGFARFKAGSVAPVALCHYLFMRQDAELAELFFESLWTGTDMRESMPVFHLRERIIASASSPRFKIGSHELVALYFKTWNAEREGREVKVLRWVPNEGFPNIGPISPVGGKEKPPVTPVAASAGKKKGKRIQPGHPA